MATIKINFQVDEFPLSLTLGGDDIKSTQVLAQVNNAIAGIKKIGGKAPNAPDTEHRCKAAYLIAERGTTPETRKKTYYKIYGGVGTWISQYGCAIWKEVMDRLSNEGILPPIDTLQIGQEYDLSGHDVVFEVERNEETGKDNPKRVIDLIKT